MITARVGQQFEARVEGFPTGLAGTVGYRILDDAGHEADGRTTVGIAESPAGSGSYIASPSAPNAIGSYSLMWDTGVVSPSTTAFEQLLVVVAAAGVVVLSDGTPVSGDGSYIPTLADVAAVIPSRAKGDFGRVSTFDDSTQPTGDQVQAIVDAEALALEGKIGEPATALLAQAKRALTYRAAAIVELTYFADQIRADRSPYNELKALYQEALADYITARANLGDDNTPGTADDQVPAYSFPPLGPVPHAPGSEIPCDAFGLDW